MRQFRLIRFDKPQWNTEGELFTLRTMYDDILTSSELLEVLKISKNTLLKLEKELKIIPDLRLGNRKRYYRSSIDRQLKKLG